MKISYDAAKNAKNIRERGLSFDRADDFEFGTATIFEVWRHGEVRFLATGFLAGRLHVLCFKGVEEGGIRVISFRKANKREVRDYETSRRNLEQRSGPYR